MVSRDIHNSTTSVKTPLKTPNPRVPKNSHLEFLNILDACQKTLTNRSVLELFPYSIISSRETTKDTCSDTGILRPYLLRLSLFNNVYEKTQPKKVFVGCISIILIFYRLVVYTFKSCLYLGKNEHLRQT